MKIRFAWWLMNNVILPKWAAPYVVGIALGRVPHRVEDDDD